MYSKKHVALIFGKYYPNAQAFTETAMKQLKRTSDYLRLYLKINAVFIIFVIA